MSNGNKTHCKWGHLFDEANTIIATVRRPTGWKKRRICRTCQRALQRAYYEDKRLPARQQEHADVR